MLDKWFADIARSRSGPWRADLRKLLFSPDAIAGRRIFAAYALDLARHGTTFTFLSFEFRRVRNKRGKWMPLYMPRMKARTKLLGKLRDVFRRYESQPVRLAIDRINPILRGWVNYFRIGHASRCFHYVRQWVERKVRRHMMRAKGRRGFGWKRWSRNWLYRMLGLFADYRIRYYYGPAARPAR